ncbi:type-F conjugative transfer system protein TrbI [Vibrio sp. S11_S32]|uniref:TrbI F-type domain-containing protein n=1 Tax=Vibrio sp. S11_S32 TaxID=2720225 RepID=UPI00168110A7|nr:TrbI F-type domain-containing protein [Vibrio sp. S11_S32]MBD1576952.1 type-F conjugative transfer system protein TrbI [Vibrio sp. S11_S32]
MTTQRLFPFIITIIVSVCISMLVMTYTQPTKIVSVNLHSLLAKQSLRLMDLKPEIAKKKRPEIAKRIDDALAIYSQSTGQVILVSNAVVQGVPDITNKINQLLN